MQAIVQRLEAEIKPQADRIMQVLLSLLQSAGNKSSVPDAVLAAIGSLANALEEDFIKYMEAFAPYLYNALGNQEEPAICAMAIGLVSDVTRALNEKVQPYCDAFMNYLLNNLRVSLPWKFFKAILTMNRALPLATDSSQRSCSALAILRRQSTEPSRHTSVSLPRSLFRLPRSPSPLRLPLRCLTTSSRFVRVSWTLGMVRLSP